MYSLDLFLTYQLNAENTEQQNKDILFVKKLNFKDNLTKHITKALKALRSTILLYALSKEFKTIFRILDLFIKTKLNLQHLLTNANGKIHLKIIKQNMCNLENEEKRKNSQLLPNLLILQTTAKKNQKTS